MEKELLIGIAICAVGTIAYMLGILHEKLKSK